MSHYSFKSGISGQGRCSTPPAWSIITTLYIVIKTNMDEPIHVSNSDEDSSDEDDINDVLLLVDSKPTIVLTHGNLNNIRNVW